MWELPPLNSECLTSLPHSWVPKEERPSLPAGAVRVSPGLTPLVLAMQKNEGGGDLVLTSHSVPSQAPGFLSHCARGHTDLPLSACGADPGLWLLEEETHKK